MGPWIGLCFAGYGVDELRIQQVYALDHENDLS